MSESACVDKANTKRKITPGSAFFDNCISTYLNIFALDRYSFSSIFKLNDLCGRFIKLKKSVLLLCLV
ncbi:hypothetical protein P8452_22871 [Trifolium repens]|nr:hypothetical protein P8452_22871 [Trifolium repens]